MKQLQNKIKLKHLEYITKRGKYDKFNKNLLPIVFLRDICEKNLALKKSHEEQSQLVNELNKMSSGRIPEEK